MLTLITTLIEKLLALLPAFFAYRAGQHNGQHSVKLLGYEKQHEHAQTRARIAAQVAGLSGPAVIDQLRGRWQRD